MGLVIPFPRSLRRQKPSEPKAPKPYPFRDATKRRVRAIIVAALAILDSLDRHPPGEAGGRTPRRRSAKAKSAQPDSIA